MEPIIQVRVLPSLYIDMYVLKVPVKKTASVKVQTIEPVFDEVREWEEFTSCDDHVIRS